MKQAELARLEIEGFAARVSGLTFRAASQTVLVERLQVAWNKARDQLDYAREVLSAYVLHHGTGWSWMYMVVWVLLMLADIAGATLVQIKAGEHPMFAFVLSIGLGVAMVTSAKLAEDFRCRLLWLRHRDNLPDDERARALVTTVFAYAEKPYLFLTRIAALIAVTAGCLVVGTLAVRMTEDGGLMALGFALWAAGVCGGSFVNAWAHTDPAHTELRFLEHTEATERKQLAKAPTDAIEQRATNERAVHERLLAHYNAAWALMHTAIAEAAGILAANPQMIGHGTDGESFLDMIQPPFVDAFRLLADTHQVPFFAIPTLPGPASGDEADTTGEDAAIIDIATRLTNHPAPLHTPTTDLNTPTDEQDTQQ
jgi:hypothetical protein